MNKMCPMKVTIPFRDECEKGNCAWYDEAEKQCAVLAISRHLHDITYRLADLNLDGMTIEKE